MSVVTALGEQSAASSIADRSWEGVCAAVAQEKAKQKKRRGRRRRGVNAP